MRWLRSHEPTQRFLFYGFLISIVVHLAIGPFLRFGRAPDVPERIETVRIDVMPTPPSTPRPPPPTPTPPPPTPPPQARRTPPRQPPVRLFAAHVVPQTPQRAQQPPVPQSDAQPQPHPEVTAATVPVSVPTPEPAPSAPAVAAVAAPPLPSATTDPAVIAAYNARLNAAVQAVFRVPSAAADMGFKGRVRVQFALRDGVVSDIQVLQPSGLPMVDRAAVVAVQSAKYPLPPAVLQGKNGIYQIWVIVT